MSIIKSDHCYLTLKGVGKCLNVVGANGLVNISHPSHAAFHCSKQDAKLVSVRDCSEIANLVGDIKLYSPSLENKAFWLGLHYPGITNSNDDRRNWFDVEFIDA